MIAVHLNHPCSEVDICDVSETDLSLMRGQGYVSLDELRSFQAELAALKQREAALVAALTEARDVLQRMIGYNQQNYCLKHMPYITLKNGDVCPACEKETK